MKQLYVLFFFIITITCRLLSNSYPVYVCTAATENSFDQVVSLIGSLHRTNFDSLGEILIYDFGVSPNQLVFLQSIKKVCIEPLSISAPLPFCAWRPHAIKQSLRKYPYVLWLDPQTIVGDSLIPLCTHVAENGYFLTVDYSTGHDIPLQTALSTYLKKQFLLDLPEREDIRSRPLVTAAIQGIARECTHGYLDPMCAVWYDMQFFADDTGQNGSDRELLSGLAYTTRLHVHKPSSGGFIALDEGSIKITWDTDPTDIHATLYMNNRAHTRLFYEQYLCYR